MSATTTKPKTGITSFVAKDADRRAIQEIRKNLERAWPRKFSASDAIRHAIRSSPLARPTAVNTG